MAGDKFCLKWNDFESHMSGSFREIRDAKDFFDVTLVCDDDQQIQAHKVIISACSPFFRNLLRRNPHQHPLIYLRGVRFHELESLLNFMYHGESNIAQTDLNSFLAVAEEFQVKGLTQSQSGGKAPPPPTPPPLHHKPVSTKKPKPILPKPSPAPAPPAVPITPRDDDVDELLPVKTELTYHEDSNQDQEMIDDVQLVDYPEESWIAEDEYEADTSYDLAAASASFVQGTDSKGKSGRNISLHFELASEVSLIFLPLSKLCAVGFDKVDVLA